MTRVNAVGYYGWGNFGDELFRAAIQLNAELIWGERAKVRSFVTPIPFLHRNLGIAGRITRLIETVVGAAWANTIALCGGSVLEDVRGTQALRGSIIRRRRIEALGVSLGPWREEASKDRVREYIERMDRVVVRDEASRTRIGIPIEVGGDLAALYPMPRYEQGARDYLTICISNDSGASLDEMAGLLGPLLAQVELPVKLLALNVRKNRGDVEFSHALALRLRESHPDIEVVKFATIDQTIDVIARSRAVWSQRLHGVIVAYLCGVPLLALSHHQKITDFSADIGLEDGFMLEDTQLTDSVFAAAAKSLSGKANWRLDPEEYKQATVAALAP